MIPPNTTLASFAVRDVRGSTKGARSWLKISSTLQPLSAPAFRSILDLLLFGDERNKSMLIDLLKSFVDIPEGEYELIATFDPKTKGFLISKLRGF